jgi:S-DNA-T family DNA segregation ATPase FtsK/SpoIIIE
MTSNWGVVQVLKSDRTGIALQPDQNDGDLIFNTDFPRVTRVDFPPGRGFYVKSAKAYRVQVGEP